MGIINTVKKEKKDWKQEFLDMVAKQNGPFAAITMDQALKHQDKQLEEAMIGGGMKAEEIAQSTGIDINSAIKKSLTNPQEKKGNFWHTPFQINQQTGEVTPESILGGLISQHPDEVLKMAQAQSLMQKTHQLSPEQQIATLTKTQDMLKKLGIKAKVDVTATGVPSLSTQPELGLSELPTEQQIQTVALARKVAGVRGADRLIPSIAEGFKQGKTIDQIEDELRLSGQSSSFTGPLRSAAQQIMAGKNTSEKQSTFDDLDDLQGQPEQQMEYLKRMAIKNSSIDQQNQVMGKERTVDFLSEIENDLNTLEKNGTPTGWISGNLEGLLSRVGQVRNPEMRKVASKLAVAIMNYRRSMTGVQFGERENKEYYRVFPNINKVGAFNTAAIKGLRETFKGDLDKFYSLSMGKENYRKLFDSSKNGGDSQDEYQQMLKILQGGK